MRNYNKIFCGIGFLIFLLMSSCTASLESVLTKDNQKIFLVAGQSNAKGVGEYRNSIFVPDKEVYEYDSVKDSLVILKDPVGQDYLGFQDAETGSFIPALSYTYNKISDQKVTCIQAARGGTSLVPEADKGWGNWSESGGLWDSSIFKTEKALQLLETPEIHAIFWCQGENDGEAIGFNLITKEDYKKGLINLINRYHARFGNIPFIIVETGRINGSNIKDAGYKEVRMIQREVAEEIDKVYIGYNETEFFIERDWLVDVVHYNQEALNDIGKKLAYFYASLVE